MMNERDHPALRPSSLDQYALVAGAVFVHFSGVDHVAQIDQPLLLRIVVAARELFVHRAPRRRVQAPGGAVRNDQHVVAPLGELREQELRSWSVLVTVDR